MWSSRRHSYEAVSSIFNRHYRYNSESDSDVVECWQLSSWGCNKIVNCHHLVSSETLCHEWHYRKTRYGSAQSQTITKDPGRQCTRIAEKNINLYISLRREMHWGPFREEHTSTIHNTLQYWLGEHQYASTEVLGQKAESLLGLQGIKRH